MGPQRVVEDQVIDVIQHTGACDIEEVARQCSTLTWNQVFLAVDHLSRCGEIELVPKGRGLYTVTLPNRQDGRPDQRSS